MVNYTQLEKAIDFQMKGLNYRVDLKRLENNSSIERLEDFFREKQDFIEIDSIKLVRETSRPELDCHFKIIEKVLRNNKNKLIDNCYAGFSNFFANEIKSKSYFIKKCDISMGNLIYFHYFMTLTLGEVYDPESLFLKYKEEYNFLKHEQIMALITELIKKETLFASSFIGKSYLKQIKEKGFAYLSLPLNIGNEIIENIIMFLVNDCNNDEDYSSFNYIYNYHIVKYNKCTMNINIDEHSAYSQNFA